MALFGTPLARDYVVVDELRAIPFKRMSEPVETFELLTANAILKQIHASAATGFTRLVGRQDCYFCWTHQ